MEPPDTTATLKMLETSADTLARSLTDLEDDQVTAASALPDWTRGHVLTHIARNADALVNLLTWARTGVETPMYPSREIRNRDIEAGASRSADEHRRDLVESQARFMAAAQEMTAADWVALIRFFRDGLEGQAAIVPWLRLVEVEVHHVDLDLGYTPAHWSPEFVTEQLVRAVQDRAHRDDTPAMRLRATDDDHEYVLGDGSGPTVSGPCAALCAWLIGRSDGHGLVVEENGERADPSAGPALPDLPPWK